MTRAGHRALTNGVADGGGGGGDGGDGDRLARRALSKIDALSRRFDEHADSDEHWMKRIEGKLDLQHEMVNKLRESTAVSAASTESILEEVRHLREIRRVEVTGEVTSRVELVKAGTIRTALRYKLAMALVGVLSALVGAVAKWLVG